MSTFFKIPEGQELRLFCECVSVAKHSVVDVLTEKSIRRERSPLTIEDVLKLKGDQFVTFIYRDYDPTPNKFEVCLSVWTKGDKGQFEEYHAWLYLDDESAAKIIENFKLTTSQ